MRLSAATPPRAGVLWPGYGARGVGILHLGLGAFARAHLAAYTEAAMAAGPGDWRIRGASLRGTDVAEALNPQDGRYTLLTRGQETRAQVVGALDSVIAGPEAAMRCVAAIADPACRIVRGGVTEKGYGLTREGGADLAHPAVAADLARPEAPAGVLGLLALGLRQRFAAGGGALTVLSCDNLPDNGHLLSLALRDFAARAHGEALAARIATEIPFPCTMVDRITPQSTPATFADAARSIGAEDRAAVETEPFSQWVMEDRFAAGRPEWEAMGATFTDDVRGWEAMKLRMLNGSHSMMAYAGVLAGLPYVRDVMADAAMARLVRRHLSAAAASLPPGGGDRAAYAGALLARFANPAIAHATAQIAMDGSQKMPQRIFAAACDVRGEDIAPFAFATAAWMRYALGRDEAGAPYPLHDPMEERLTAALAPARTAAEIFDAIAGLGLLPDPLRSGAFREATVSRLGLMLEQGMRAAVEREAA